MLYSISNKVYTPVHGNIFIMSSLPNQDQCCSILIDKVKQREATPRLQLDLASTYLNTQVPTINIDFPTNYQVSSTDILILVSITRHSSNTSYHFGNCNGFGGQRTNYLNPNHKFFVIIVRKLVILRANAKDCMDFLKISSLLKVKIHFLSRMFMVVILRILVV